MFTKLNLFAAALVSTLALSAFSAESTVVGRYKVDAPADTGVSTAQVGRYRGAYSNAGTVAAQNPSNWDTIGQSQMVGRSQNNVFNAPGASYAVPAAEYAGIRTQRGQAADVSFPRANQAGGCK